MNRFQYGNIDENVTAQERERALKPKGINTRVHNTKKGIFVGLSTGRRKALKQKAAAK